MRPIRDNARVLMAAMAGTAIEYYDFFIYGTAAALVFGPLFFPAESEGAQTLLAFMSIGIAFIARPFGAIAFGHFGDRIGRKSTLVASLLLMGGSTLLIAFLPTYAMTGWVAPVLLCVLRFGQGLGLGGEWAGASLLAVENAPEGWAGRFGSAPQLGVPLGFIMANGLFLLLGLWLTEAEFIEWGWRVPFVVSAALVAIGLWMRLKLTETARFREALEHEPPVQVPIVRLLKEHPREVIAGAAGAVACYAVFYMVTSFALAQATGPLGYQREAFLGIQMVAALFLAVSNILAGIRADSTSPASTLKLGAAGIILIGLVYGAGLGSGSLALAALTLCTTLLVMGFTNAPLAGWLTALFPVRVRYSGVAFSHNIGGIVGGATTPILAQYLVTQGASTQTGLLLSVAGAITFLGAMLGRPRF